MRVLWLCLRQCLKTRRRYVRRLLRIPTTACYLRAKNTSFISWDDQTEFPSSVTMPMFLIEWVGFILEVVHITPEFLGSIYISGITIKQAVSGHVVLTLRFAPVI